MIAGRITGWIMAGLFIGMVMRRNDPPATRQEWLVCVLVYSIFGVPLLLIAMLYMARHLWEELWFIISKEI